MENIKQQIEECKKAIAEINQAKDKTVKYFENKIKQLEQHVNKPKIEIGKVYKSVNNKAIYYVVEFNGYGKDGKNYGFDYNGNWIKLDVRKFNKECLNDIEATKEEWETALEKQADKLYEGVEKVDKTGLDFAYLNVIGNLRNGCPTRITSDGTFEYNGVFVMDKKGVWAKPVIEEKEMFVNLYQLDNLSWIYNSIEDAKQSAELNKESHRGIFKLVKV
jgi:hypothetical protein